MWVDIIVALAVATIPALGAWITSQVIPWIKARTTAEQRKNLMALVRTAVAGAEQIFKQEAQAAESVAAKKDVNRKKKQFVRERLQAEGVTLPPDEIGTMIEAAVLELRIKREWRTDDAIEAMEDATDAMNDLTAELGSMRADVVIEEYPGS